MTQFDPDYGPYLGDPRDPRYDDSEDLAREEWEYDTPYKDMIGLDMMEDILLELYTGSPNTACTMIEKAVDLAWSEHVKKLEQDR